MRVCVIWFFLFMLSRRYWKCVFRRICWFAGYGFEAYSCFYVCDYDACRDFAWINVVWWWEECRRWVIFRVWNRNFIMTLLISTFSTAHLKLTQGLMSAISAGMLIYAACVEMLAGDFVMDPLLWRSSIKRQSLAIVSLVLGAGCMSVIG